MKLLALDAPSLLDELEAHWSGQSSFYLPPTRSGLPPTTLARWLSSVPDSCREGHFVLTTSGSTGLPKLVVGSMARAERLAGVLHAAQELDTVQETLLSLPLSYSYAFVNQWVWARTLRRRVVATRGLARPDELLDAFAGAHAAMVCLVGAQVPLMRRAWGSRGRFPGVQVVNFAGGPFPRSELSWVRSTFPRARIYDNFGCTEAMPRLTVRHVDPDAPAGSIGVLGRPIEGVQLRLGDGDALEFRSAHAAVGVVDETGWRPLGDWTPTGDRAEQLSSGEWRVLGRHGEVFKRYGELVALPALLEIVRGEWSGQAAFYVERPADAEPRHVLVLAPETEREQLRSLLRAFRSRVGRAAWPARIEAVASLPTLPSGKVDVAALPAVASKRVIWTSRT